MNNKGLANGLIAIMILLFVFGFISVLVIKIHSEWSGAINDLDESVASDETKLLISQNTQGIFLLDKLFTIFLIVLLISYLVTSFTLPTKNAWFFLLFIGFLIIITVVAMVLSNSWTYMLSNPFFDGYQ